MINMVRSFEQKKLIEKRNLEIRENFPKVFRSENFSVLKTIEKMSGQYYLAPDTIRHIVYKIGNYKIKK